ncbi:MAG: DinB family protein [Actinomycetes bacterium]|jgi:uncharacterized damage-inducible protein DinB
MSATTNRLLRHMAWANQRVYDAVQQLPDEALRAYIANPEWTAGHLLQHIVGSANWYEYCLTGAPWRDIKFPESMTDLDLLKEQLAEFDANISSQADLPDEYLTIVDEERSFQSLRSTILAEAIYHAAEHRTQLVDALEARGFIPLALDDLDLWKFERYEKKSEK